MSQKEWDTDKVVTMTVKNLSETHDSPRYFHNGDRKLQGHGC